MLDALTLDQIRVFAAIAEKGSFRAAALKVGRAQSAISHAIANLEAELKVTLFDRSRHKPQLTEEGRILLEDCKALLLRADLIRAKAQGMGSGVEIELSLIVDTLFPMNIVADALRQLHSVYPSVAVELRIGTLGEPIEAISCGAVDLGIAMGEDVRDPRLAFEALDELEMVAVISSSHPLAEHAQERMIDAAEIADHLQIVLADPSALSNGRD